MGYPIIPESLYLWWAQHFHVAAREHFTLVLVSTTGRHKRSEVVLPRLVQKGQLRALYYQGHRLVYAVPRRCRGAFPQIEHGLGASDGLVRCWLARSEGTILPERTFRGLGCVPEWGIHYPEGKLLLFEYGTAANFEQTKAKVRAYRQHLPAIERQLGGEALVLFVLDVPRPAVARLVTALHPVGPYFFFTDAETFRRVPYGQQLSAPIYLWGEDGQSYALSAAATTWEAA